MKKHAFYSLLGIFLSFFLMSPSCEKNAPAEEIAVESDTIEVEEEEEASIVELLSYDYSNKFPGKWGRVDSLDQLGLYASALEMVDSIFISATEDNNAPEIVKCVIHRMKYNSYLEEDDFISSLAELNTLSSTASFPLKQLIHSITAQSYWQYYQNNRWKIMNRTETVGFKNDDVRTWDLNKISDEMRTQYLLSLTASDSAQHTDIKDFESILIDTLKSYRQRPSLYDFLAHRALNFFENTEMNVSRPEGKYVIEGADYFGNNTEFLKLPTASTDERSNALQWTRIMKELTLFHRHDLYPEAKVDLQLIRLRYAKQKTIESEKDDLYRTALERLAEIHKSHEIYAEIQYALASHYVNIGTSYGPIKEEHRWDLRTANTICTEAVERFPESYGAKHCLALQSSIHKMQLSFRVENGYAPNSNGKLLLTYKNIDSIYLRKVKVNWNVYSNHGMSSEDIMLDLLSKPVVEEWSEGLTNPGDFREHKTELLLKSKDLGHYVVLASPNKDFVLDSNAVGRTSYWTTNLSYSYRQNENNTIDVFVTDRETGHPVKGSKVQISLKKWNSALEKYEWRKQESYITEKDGTVNIKSPSKYRNIYIEITKGSDQFSNLNAIYQYKNYSSPKTTTTTTIFTDRAIYRPGQTIYFKGIKLKHNGNNHEVVKGKKSTVRFYDNNGEEISRLELTTNEYGTYSGSFIAPSGVLNGSMRIETEDGSKYISIEEYKRPKFEVEFKPIEGNFKIGQNVEVNGFAKAFAGSSIDGAKVSYYITRSSSYSPWARYYWSNMPYSSSTQVAKGEITTDENGEFLIRFKAQEDKTIDSKYFPKYTYVVNADVTDINGETRSSQQYVIVGYNCMSLSMNIASNIERNGTDKYRVNTINLNGQKVEASGTIQVHQLQEPKAVYRSGVWEKPDIQMFSKEKYAKLFPHDEYDNETDIKKFEKGTKVLDLGFNTADSDSVVFSNQKSWQPGRYVVELSATDAFGEEVKDIHYITITDKKSKANPTSEIWSVVPVKATCEPGENAEFLISTAAKELSILYEIKKDGKTLKKEILQLNQSQKLISIPILESYRGNISISFAATKFGRALSSQQTIYVPYSNKELELEFETFRNKLLPGAKEEWKIKIKGPKGEKVAAEMLATMYDASLDAFAENHIYLNVHNASYSSEYWNNSSLNPNSSSVFSKNWNHGYRASHRYYNNLNWWGAETGVYLGSYGNVVYDWADIDVPDAIAFNSVSESTVQTRTKKFEKGTGTGGLTETGELEYRSVTDEENIDRNNYAGNKRDEDKKVQVRTNFNETAFFYPQLETNSDGEVIIKFTIPESLTEWKFLGMAHTEDLKIGYLTGKVVTQKELMILSNAPRFFREGDKMSFAAKVSNLSEDDLEGTAELMLFDALTMDRIDSLFKLDNSTLDFSAMKGQSARLSWNIEIPEGIGAVTYRVVAKAGTNSDGEEMAVPILSNRMLVTESMPMPSKRIGTDNFTFEKLVNSGTSSTLKHHKLTLEYTANPGWYAVQAIPYMMEYPYECAEQTFTRFYANSIASNIVNSSPKIKAVFEQWKASSPDAFLSNLEKNQELKSLMIEETPWVLDAQNESERKKRIALLFDMNKMDNELSSALNKLENMQANNGGWAWFPGMKENRYITQHIITGMGHLDNLGVKNIRKDAKTWRMVNRGIKYLDKKLVEDYNWLVSNEPDYLTEKHISQLHIQYLYARSYFPDVERSSELKKAMTYYQNQADKYWLKFNLYNQGMIALQAHRDGQLGLAGDIINSLKERAIMHEEFGMYWKNNTQGYYWYQAPIETHSLLIEAFDAIVEDDNLTNELKVWLLKQKQTTDWKTTKATAEACYALLLRGTDLLTVDTPIEIKVNNILVDAKSRGEKVEAGTGYFKTSWSGNEITPEMGNVSVTRSTEGVSWGAMYWQYFEDLDKITPHETPLQLNKKLFLVIMTDEGEKMTPVTDETTLKPGDKVRVRIELHSDRNMEYVHLKDMRAAGFEPINVFSRYKWQDGLGYYESTKDAATNFFIEYLPKGTFVFEYDVRVSQFGDFSNGISTIQCMYAPEFTSHSEGIRVMVKEEE